MAKRPKSDTLKQARRKQAGQKKKQALIQRLTAPDRVRPFLKTMPCVPVSELMKNAEKVLTYHPTKAEFSCIFFSFTDGSKRAEVIHFPDTSVREIRPKVNRILKQRHKNKPVTARWLRVDWVTGVTEHTWESLTNLLSEHKRNYFRYGISLDPGFRFAFLEQELNANAMLSSGPDIVHAQVNEKNFAGYARRRFGPAVPLAFDPQTPVYTFTTNALLIEPAQPPRKLYGFSGGIEGRDTGRRQIDSLDRDTVYQLIDHGSRFLADQVKEDGRFVYGIFPCFDKDIAYYNTLRHASATYSMLEAWEVTQDDRLKQAIDRSLSCIADTLVHSYTLPTGEQVAYVTDTGDEIKLGGNAMCILAMVKHTELTEDDRYLPLMIQLALGICHLQDTATGRLTHVLDARNLSVKEQFRIIYYDGMAAFGLMRLYGLTKDPRWLAAVEKAFAYFIAENHWQAHDHWLSYCVNELTRYRPEEKYFRFGIQHVAGYLDFVLERTTTFPTPLELMMAAHKMIRRLGQQPDMRHLLTLLDLDKFYRALEHRAGYLLNDHFWPEIAMFFKNPQRILGGFFIRHHGFRVRIDDVEHYLSGYAAYLKHYLDQSYQADLHAESNGTGTKGQAVFQDIRAPENSPLPESLGVIFLNLDIGERLTGIEQSALTRASLFITELALYPLVVTLRYRPYLQHHVKNVLNTGRYHPDSQVIGLYDVVQGFHTPGRSWKTQQNEQPPVVAPAFPDYQATTVKGYKDIRYLDARARLYAYQVYSKVHGGLTHINYFDNGKKTGADFFHVTGHRSSHKIFDPDTGKATHEIYFNPWGAPLFFRILEVPEDTPSLPENRKAGFYLLPALQPQTSISDESHHKRASGVLPAGNLSTKNISAMVDQGRYLGDEVDFHHFALKTLIDSLPHQRVVIISDKNKFAFQPAVQLRKQLRNSDRELRVLGALHSTHYQGKKPDGRIKTHYRTLLQPDFPRADGVIALTQSQRRDVQIRFPGEKLAVVPHTLIHIAAPDKAVSLKKGRQKGKIVYMARLSPEKQHTLALDIFSQVVRQVPEAHLHFYGEGKERNKIKARIRELNLEQKVTLEGYCTRIEEVYQEAQVTILTSKMEGFSLSLLEAMAYGCPAIAFDINYGPRDMIAQGETGYLIPYGDKALFARHLVAILTQPDLAARLGDNAQKRFWQKFSPSQVALLWKRIIAGLFNHQYTEVESDVSVAPQRADHTSEPIFS
jgi:glycosyltransferase involved in cell wall biosynthesis